MVHVCRVNIFQTSQKLIQEKLMVILRQVIVRFDHLVQICIQKFEYYVDVFKLSRIRG